jgi:hypothetical protein
MTVSNDTQSGGRGTSGEGQAGNNTQTRKRVHKIKEKKAVCCEMILVQYEAD